MYIYKQEEGTNSTSKKTNIIEVDLVYDAVAVLAAREHDLGNS